MHFFTVIDPAAPSIEKHSKEDSWNTAERLHFARSAAQALAELHEAGPENEPMVHRNLTSETILVKHDNSPILTGFKRTKIPADISIASNIQSTKELSSSVAPEVCSEGIGAADYRSDIYSLCVCLTVLFEGREDRKSLETIDVLAQGIEEDPDSRIELGALENSLSGLLGESVPQFEEPPPSRLWTEDQSVLFKGHEYRIVARLGSGGTGTAFKVVQVNRKTKEELGTYVAKVAHAEDVGNRVLESYNLVRPHLGRHVELSAIFEVATEWKENGFIALMTWVEGTALRDFSGVLSLLAEDLQQPSEENLAIAWVQTMCEALRILHGNSLVHGDVSPSNMIVSGSDPQFSA